MFRYGDFNRLAGKTGGLRRDVREKEAREETAAHSEPKHFRSSDQKTVSVVLLLGVHSLCATG
jgi:hypothetical protein